jgi:hypothetical protein
VIGSFIYLLTKPRSPYVSEAVLLLPILLILICTAAIINVFISKVEITDSSVTRISILGKRTLLLADIKGCRVGEKVISIIPISDNKKKIIINNYIDFADSKDLKKWLQSSFPDLNVIDKEKNKEAVLSDINLGLNVEERESKLKKAKLLAIIYNVFSALAFILMFISTRPFAYYFLLLYPLLSVIIMLFSKGLIKFFGSKSTVYGTVTFGVFFPSFVLLYTSFSNYPASIYTNFWLPFFIICFILFLLLALPGINKNAGFVKAQYITILIISLIYACGATQTINGGFDKSVPQKYQSYIIQKFHTNGKGRHYHVRIKQWHENQDTQIIDISESRYGTINANDPVMVYENAGVLHIPWYNVAFK